jgi:apolipoprotein N-acyltransferase
LWFGLNDYWVYNTMHVYGNMNAAMAVLCLVLFSLFLGVWFGVFALALAVVRLAGLRLRREWIAFAAVPFLWVGMELAIARIPNFPWDQLGYSQVGNGLLTRLAPWTGVYGISFLLAGVNALFATAVLVRGQSRIGSRIACAVAAVAIAGMGMSGLAAKPVRPAGEATAVLVQPNLSVDEDNSWDGREWDRRIDQFKEMAAESCKGFLDGVPEGSGRLVLPKCVMPMAAPTLIVWPESPAPFRDAEPRFQTAMASIAKSAPLIVGDIGMTEDETARRIHFYNSATVLAQGGQLIGRYDKMHLVPFGEYIPFRKLFFFVHQLTEQLSDMGGGDARKVFRIAPVGGEAHRYGIFICYESVFADEVRQFARLGAEVFVNISDDGWYGDSSAPWQHLNMARMRAIENRRWILRDTNTGVTSVIDPYGTVRQSIPRHQADVLPARYGFNSEMTFYTEHGDWFAGLCAILSLALLAVSGRVLLGYPAHSTARP